MTSFAICGIYDKPGSEMPIGQPVFAAKAYTEYMDWKDGKGRWPLLAASFFSDLKHDAISVWSNFQALFCVFSALMRTGYKGLKNYHKQ